MDRPASLFRDISPPPIKRRKKISEAAKLSNGPSLSSKPSLAAVEAGKVKVDDHLAFFTENFSKNSRQTDPDVPRLSLEQFADLYTRNQHDHGNHFVIHQHNHPQAGVHYDLRLQFSKSSSLSFVIPKGLPGNPNSKSPGRMAIETRVHNLWNHLIESASHKSGSLLIWDTGTYSVLPRKIAVTREPETTDPGTTDSDTEVECRSSSNAANGKTVVHENDKLIEAFQGRYIRLRFHGTRLPKDFTVTIRLPLNNDMGNARPAHLQRRRRRKSAQKMPLDRQTTATSDSEAEAQPALQRTPSLSPAPEQEQNLDTDSEEDLETRVNNAYPGSSNTIGSVHQRKWLLALDRRSSGFKPGTLGVWERDGEGGFEPFFVRGRDFERSVVTGRLAREVERDEGVEGYVGRAGWTGITR